MTSTSKENPPVDKNDKGDERNEDITPSPSHDLDADAALEKLMKYSRWRLIIYSILCLAVNIPGTWLMLSIVFIGGEPDGFSCYRPPENATMEEVAAREKISQSNTAADLYFGKEPVKECEPPGNTSVTTCTGGYTYHTQTGPTIVTDWDLVCDRNYLSETSQVVFGAGVMVGALFIPTLADRFGRWSVQLVCQWTAIVFGVGIAFSDSITTFIVLRFFLGALREGLGLSGIVMACELFPAQMRPVAGIALQFFWCGAWMLLALLAYLIRQWRHLQIALTVISILPAAAVWFAPESVIWLVAKGKAEKAEGILQKAVKFDKDPYAPEYFLVKPKSEKQQPDVSDVKKENIELDNVEKPETNVNKTDVTEAQTTQYTLLNIPKSRRLCIYTANMCLLWFINVVVYYGLSLGASLIPGGNRYLFFFLSGLVEIPAYGLAMLLTKTFGRRIPLAGFHAVAAVGLFGMLLAKGYSNEETGITEAALSMLGKFGITASFAILVVYANEIFPTTLRNAGFGLASTFGRLGSILAPVAVYVAKEDTTIPILLFAILALMAVFAGIILPETANFPLPNTIEDVEGWEPGCVSFSRWSKKCVKDACKDDVEPIKAELQK